MTECQLNAHGGWDTSSPTLLESYLAYGSDSIQGNVGDSLYLYCQESAYPALSLF